MKNIQTAIVEKFENILNGPTPQDYIQLYLLSKKHQFTIQQLRSWYYKKYQKYNLEVEPLTIAICLLRANEITKLPQMHIPFSRPKMITFFQSLAKSLEPEIFK